MRASRAHNDQPRPTGFTLVEMLVAVGIGAALVAGAAGVFSLASQSIKSSQANTEISSNLRVVCSWLQRDFNRIRLDGPLVLHPGGYTTAENEDIYADRVFFVISGDIPSLTEPDFHAALAMITYGQDDSVDYIPAEYSTFLTRRAGLIVADPPANSQEPAVQDREIHLWSFAGLVAYWNGNSWPWLFWERPDLAGATADLGYTRMLENVLSFRIAGYYRPGDGQPVVFDPYDPPIPPIAPIEFGPNAEKPVWIDFEIKFRDSNKVVRDGYTATYRVHLPTE